jgi:hypothetical protein
MVPSIKVHIPTDQENSVLRKAEQFSIRIIPLSTTRQPLEIVDTTFVIKPEETMIDEEPNGTYRACHQHYHSHLRVPQPETSLLDSQPNIPARLCFSPSILQDETITPDENINEQLSSSDNEERFKTIFLPIDQNRTSKKMIVSFQDDFSFDVDIRKPIEDARRFGQTFLLDIVKTEQINNDQNDYIRPAIPDDDVLVVFDTNSSKHRPRKLPET